MRDMRRDEKYEVARTKSREVCGGCAREEDERCYRDDAHLDVRRVSLRFVEKNGRGESFKVELREMQ